MNVLRQAAAVGRHYRPSCLQQQQRSFDILIDPVAISRQQEKKNKKNRKSWRPSYRFVDRTRVRVSGGRGGKGSLSSHQMQKAHKLRPDGGHGGNGGSVIIVADPNEQTLRWSQPHVIADNGTNGSSQEKFGRNGKNLIVRVPCGVVVKRILDHDEEWDENRQEVRQRVPIPHYFGLDDDAPSEGSEGQDVQERAQKPQYYNLDDDSQSAANQESASGGNGYEFTEEDVEDDVERLKEGLEIDVFPSGNAKTIDEEYDAYAASSKKDQDRRKSIVLADLDNPGSHLMVARGGQGGVGTCRYASSHGPLPEVDLIAQNAQPDLGEVAFLELELKSIADIGLVGFPNAGKSSLLRAMSQAAPEVAPYPFTTLHPIIGCIEYRDGFRVQVADIPGLISGASEGKGRGHDFLRHVERTKALLYIVDAAGVDFRDPVTDLNVIANELASYGDGSLLERRALVVANKLDLLSADYIPEVLAAIAEAATSIGIDYEDDVIGISAGVTGEGLAGLSKAMRGIVSQSEEERALEFESRVR